MHHTRLRPYSNMPSNQSPGSERRKSPRHCIKAKVALKGRPRAEMEVLDLSAQGIGLRTDLRTGVGRTLELDFIGYSLRVEGTVRHESKTLGSASRVGVEFLQPQPELEEVALLLSNTGA